MYKSGKVEICKEVWGSCFSAKLHSKAKHAMTQFRRAALRKYCHTGFKHAHDCRKINK